MHSIGWQLASGYKYNLRRNHVEKGNNIGLCAMLSKRREKIEQRMIRAVAVLC